MYNCFFKRVFYTAPNGRCFFASSILVFMVILPFAVYKQDWEHHLYHVILSIVVGIFLSMILFCCANDRNCKERSIILPVIEPV